MTEEMAGAEVKEEPKQVEPPKPLTFEDVEATLRIAIREAANEVISASDETEGFEDLDRIAGAGNVATVWTNICIGLIGGLERLRLSHDQITGATKVTPLPSSNERQLLKAIKDEADKGASPTKIAQLIAASGLFVTEE